MSAFSSSSAPSNTMYTIEDFGEKGKGLVAAKDIGPGDTIIKESPILVLDKNSNELQIHASYIDHFSQADKARFKALTYHADAEDLNNLAKLSGGEAWDVERGRVMALYNTNCMSDIRGNTLYLAIQASRINHSCRPNSTYDCFEPHVVVKALQHIPEGSEITIAYVSPLWNVNRRSEKLWNTWGFRCDCAACATSDPRPLLSNKVAEELQKAEAELEKLRDRALDFEEAEQAKLCEFCIERMYNIPSLIPTTVVKFLIYLTKLQKTKQLQTPNAKEWIPIGVDLARIYWGKEHRYTRKLVDVAEQLKE